MDASGAWRGRRGDARERVVRVKKVRFERRILVDGEGGFLGGRKKLVGFIRTEVLE